MNNKSIWGGQEKYSCPQMEMIDITPSAVLCGSDKTITFQPFDDIEDDTDVITF